MAAFDIEDLRQRDFIGFIPIGQLDRQPSEVPLDSGVYAVARREEGDPAFLGTSGGGWWKKRDPTVPISRLRTEWVDGAQTLYIGKADSLRVRIDLLIGFACGEPIMHWGGRLLWQVEKCEELLVAWKAEPCFAVVETKLLDEFIEIYGRLPFANLRRERATCLGGEIATRR